MNACMALFFQIWYAVVLWRHLLHLVHLACLLHVRDVATCCTTVKSICMKLFKLNEYSKGQEELAIFKMWGHMIQNPERVTRRVQRTPFYFSGCLTQDKERRTFFFLVLLPYQTWLLEIADSAHLASVLHTQLKVFFRSLCN